MLTRIKRFQCLYCLACRKRNWEKSWSGLHGDAIWIAWSMQAHLEPNKLALLCLFPKHSHLFAFPKWSCFNILQQSVLQCVLSAKLVITKSQSAKKWSEHCISLASFLIFRLDGIVSHTIQLSCPSVYSTYRTECFLFSLPCVLSFVTFSILMTWMHKASLWISDSTTSSRQYFTGRVALHHPRSTHCSSLLQSFISIVFSSFRCNPNHHWLLSLALLAFAEEASFLLWVLLAKSKVLAWEKASFRGMSYNFIIILSQMHLLYIAQLWACSWPPRDFFFQAWLLVGAIPASVVCCLCHFCLHLILHPPSSMANGEKSLLCKIATNDCLKESRMWDSIHTDFQWFCQESASMLWAPVILLFGMTKLLYF